MPAPDLVVLVFPCVPVRYEVLTLLFAIRKNTAFDHRVTYVMRTVFLRAFFEYFVTSKPKKKNSPRNLVDV